MDDLTTIAMHAREGNRESYAKFVKRSQADVWRLCSHLVNTQEADDLTQDTYLRAAGALRSFRGESSAHTWLLAIARRTCFDFLRKQYRNSSRDAKLSPVDADAQTGVSEINLLIDALSVERRAAFVLTQIIGLSYADAGVICDCPVGTIRSRVARAREELSHALSDPQAQPTSNAPQTIKSA